MAIETKVDPNLAVPPAITEAIHAKDFNTVRDYLRQLSPPEVASIIEQLPRGDQVTAFRVLPRDLATIAFAWMSLPEQEELIRDMGQEEVAEVLNGMSDDDRTRLLEELPANVTQKLLTTLEPKERAIASQLLGYPPNSVGRLMTPHYVRVRPEWTVVYALDHIRRYGQDSETLNVVYVIDEAGKLIDDIRIRTLLLAPSDKWVSDLMDRRYMSLKATDSKEDAVVLIRNSNRTALPVTDSSGVLIGIVTIDDLLNVAVDEATEDIQKIGGSETLDEPYLTIPIPRMIRKRGSWLVILFLGEMLTATAMGFFEKEIERAVVLALFVPLIISSGGNSGSQASTLVIRSLALRETRLRDWFRVFRREIISGLGLGLILGTIGFLRITLWSLFSDIYGPHWPLIALTIGITLVFIVLWGSLAGSMLPFILKRVGVDPATSSAPFVATLVDVTGLIIYFTVASIVLSGTLL